MRCKKIVLRHPLFVKGKGLPKEGVQFFREGEEVTICSENGAEWFVKAFYKGRHIRIATIPSSL